MKSTNFLATLTLLLATATAAPVARKFLYLSYPL